jgi:hypothetical protein
MKMSKPNPEQELAPYVEDGVTRFKMVPKWKVPHTFHNSKSFMDYLHGDVDETEAEVACLYEYARESRTMWEAAKRRDELMVSGMNPEHAGRRAWRESCLELGTTILPYTTHFLGCEAFPSKDWNELSREQRQQITRFLPTRRIRPLFMPDVWTLGAMGILDRFKAMAEQATPVIEELRPGETGKPTKVVWPILQQHESFYHVIFTLDFRKSEAQLLNEFREWLRLAENKERLAKYKMPKTGTTGAPLDRMKDLAAWRLYRESNNDWDAANDFANAHRKRLTGTEIGKKYKNKTVGERKEIKAGSKKPFRDAKRQGEKPPNQADLFGEEADAYKAEATAREYLTRIMPMDFPPKPGPFMQAMRDELAKVASKK